jgi:hypothetical protein
MSWPLHLFSLLIAMTLDAHHTASVAEFVLSVVPSVVQTSVVSGTVSGVFPQVFPHCSNIGSNQAAFPIGFPTFLILSNSSVNSLQIYRMSRYRS